MTMSKLGTLVCLLVLCLPHVAVAGKWPFRTFASSTVIHEKAAPKRVAIIGAGAAGSSAAYHLSKFARDAEVEVEITLFEKSAHVGGRSTTVNAWNDPSVPVELGASIFVEVNKILKNAAIHFNLSTSGRRSIDEEPETLGIWNGERFVFTQKDGGWQWWDTTKLLWKYGWAPVRTQNLMEATVAKLLKLYEAPFFPFRSLSDRAEDLDLIALTAVTGQQFLEANDIGAPFSTDIIQASTRVNYGQNLGIIHGLETMVCMAISGAMAIEGGNWQIFSNMIKESGATLNQNTTVTEIKRQDGRFTLTSKASTKRVSSPEFDSIVLAAPLQFSGIKIQEGLARYFPDEIPYVKLHVTLFASPHKINGKLFNLAPGAEVPTSILTTLGPNEDPSNRTDIVGKSGFFSVSNLRSGINPVTGKKEYLYKIFSPRAVSNKFLSELFNITLPANAENLIKHPTSDISWYFPYIWNSYPYEYPRVTFEEVELGRHFYYTSGMDSFISTMETNALMGKNVAQLIVDDFVQLMSMKSSGDRRQKVVAEEL